MAERVPDSPASTSAGNGLGRTIPEDLLTSGPAQAFGGQSAEQPFAATSKQIALLVEVNTLLAESYASEPVLERILAGLREWDQAVRVSLYRFDRREHLLRPVSGIQSTDQGNEQGLPAAAPELVAQVVRNGRPAYAPERDGPPEPFGGQFPLPAEYAVPLRAGGNVLGALYLESEHPEGISRETRQLADQCAIQAALALERDALPLNLTELEGTPLPHPASPQLQERLRQAQKMEAIGTLAGGIAHDFNNLLGVILGFASLARVRLRPGDPLQESLRMIEQSAERAADLSRQLLTFARPEKGEEMCSTTIEEILERVLKIVTQTFDRRIQIHTCVEASLPPVKSAANMLEQVILNLCLNARDAMPAGGTISVEATTATFASGSAELPAAAAPGTYVRVTVIDTGAGIDPEALKHIFEPFFTTKEKGKGSGLGLAMVREIVGRHAGFVRVESQVGGGSRFSVCLPALPQALEKQGRKKPLRLERGHGEVLVVDDEPLVLAFVQKALRRLGYRVLTADNGKEACRIYAPRAREIDCVLLDMIMPEMSGLETLHKLREINSQVRVILSSGYDPEGETRRLVESGAVAMLSKPYSLETLAHTLRGSP